MEKKKNSKNYIIPASYFAKKGITPIPVQRPKVEEKILPKKEENKPVTVTASQPVASKPSTEKTPNILLNKQPKRSSGLSLKSIRLKKEHQIKQMDVVLDEEDLPSDAFTEEALIAAWYAFVKKTEENGQHNLASILSIDKPKINGTEIHVEYPNATNKIEIERQQYPLLGFIRKQVNNYDITLVVTVNEELDKKYAYSTKDKFEKLMDKNPNIELLRKTFDLDV